MISPQAPNFDYYDANEPGVLLDADEKRGIYMLVERIRGLASAYRTINPILPNNRTNDDLRTSFFQEVLSRYNELLKDGLIDRKMLVAAATKRRQPIASGHSPLF